MQNKTLLAVLKIENDQFKTSTIRTWRYKPVIPARGSLTQEDCQVQGHSEFQASLGNIARHCSQPNNNNNNNNNIKPSQTRFYFYSYLNLEVLSYSI
jgi:hypothetical protein